MYIILNVIFEKNSNVVLYIENFYVCLQCNTKQTTKNYNIMANVREKILKELDVQEKIEGRIDDNIEILRRVVLVIKSQHTWNNLVKVKFHRYGKLSYEVHRFYYPTDELMQLIKVGFEFPSVFQSRMEEKENEEIDTTFDTVNVPNVQVAIDGKVYLVSSEYLMEISKTELSKEEKSELLLKHPQTKLVITKEVK